MPILIGPMGIFFLVFFIAERADEPDVEVVYDVPLCLNAPLRANLRMTRQYAMPMIGADWPVINKQMYNPGRRLTNLRQGQVAKEWEKNVIPVMSAVTLTEELPAKS